MQISVKGFGKRKTQELTEAAEFFALQLMDPRMVRNLVIDIEKDTTIEVMGECLNDDDRSRDPRWFTITLRGHKDDEDVVQTLSHEMVHVKQYAKNELGAERSMVAKGKSLHLATKWKGEWWTPSKKEDPYFDAPWEIEAYGREVGLWYKWCNRKAEK